MSDKRWALVGLTDADAARWRAADAEEGPLVGRLVAVEGVEPAAKLRRLSAQCREHIESPGSAGGEQSGVRLHPDKLDMLLDQLEAARAEVAALRKRFGDTLRRIAAHAEEQRDGALGFYLLDRHPEAFPEGAKAEAVPGGDHE